MIARSKETMTVEIPSEMQITIPRNVLRYTMLDSGFEGIVSATSELLRISMDPPRSAFSPAPCEGMSWLSKLLASAFSSSFVFIVSAVCVGPPQNF